METDNKGNNKGLNNLVPAKPGEVRNPTGRPKKDPIVLQTLNSRIKDVAENMVKIACGELSGTKPSDMVRAGELVLAYVIGKPTQQIDISSTRPIIIAPGILEAPPYEPDA